MVGVRVDSKNEMRFELLMKAKRLFQLSAMDAAAPLLDYHHGAVLAILRRVVRLAANGSETGASLSALPAACASCTDTRTPIAGSFGVVRNHSVHGLLGMSKQRE